MKVCIVVDAIDKYDTQRVILDTLVSLGDECEVAALYVKKSSIIIPISLKKISSSFLSKLYKTSYGLFKNPIFTEQVAKRFKLPEADFYFVISSGFSHFVKIPKGKKAYYYFLDTPLHLKKTKRSRDALNSRFKKSVNNLPYKAFSTHRLASRIADEKSNFDVIAPPFKSRDFPQPAQFNQINSNKIIVNLFHKDDIHWKELATEKYDQYEFLVLTSLDVKKELESEFDNLKILTSVSNHELYIELLNSYLYIDFSETYSEKVFAALASGTTCMLNMKTDLNEYFTDDVINYFDKKNFLRDFNLVLDRNKQFKPEILRRFSLRFNERVFKNKFSKILDSIV